MGGVDERNGIGRVRGVWGVGTVVEVVPVGAVAGALAEAPSEANEQLCVIACSRLTMCSMHMQLSDMDCNNSHSDRCCTVGE